MKPRILVIRGGAIGDFILTLPAIHLLREAFPKAHLEILGYKHIVALAEGRFYADATRSIEYGPLAGFFTPRSELSPELIEYFTSFQQIVSYLYDPDGFFVANLRRAGVKNIIQAYRTVDDTEHAARQLAAPLQQLALYLDDHQSRVFPSEDDRLQANLLIKENDESPMIAVHPGSGSPKKNWPLDRWAQLGRGLAEAFPSYRLLLISGEADLPQCDYLSEAWGGIRLLLARELPLPHLAAVLEQCRLFLGHDSGISHLAAAVGTPSLLLFGPTDAAIWGPSHSNARILEAPEGDLEQLTVETVKAAAADLLA